jgi:DNA-binding Lrp family transcriptional regulator
MTATTAGPRPVAGPLFLAAARVNVGGRRRRKVFALLGAFADVGQSAPPITELAARLGLKPRAVVGLLARLEADGHLKIDRSARPYAYALNLPEPKAGERR